MIGFLLTIRKLMSKRKPNRKFTHWLLVTLVMPLVSVLGVLFAFFMFDDFNIYVLLSLEQKAQTDYRNSGASGSYYGDWSKDPTGGSSGMLAGQQGLANMYINSMSGGYYKEMLEIIRDHADWTYMNDNVSPVIRNGEAVYPQVQQTLGTMLSEGGAENEGTTRVSPATTLSAKYYDASDGKHSLATYNSEVVREDGGSTLASGYNGSMDLYYNGATDMRTNLQFRADFAAIYPSGRLVAEADFWPSKMNGYGISDTTERTKADTDAAYFPDQLSIMIQRSWCMLNNGTYWDMSAMTDTALNTAMYLPYNYGDAGFAYAWGLGIRSSLENKPFTRGGWSSKNTITFQQNTSYSVNYFDEIIVESLNRLEAGWDGYVSGIWDGSDYNYWYINHSDYKGFGAMALMLNGCFADPAVADEVRNNFSNRGFLRGATVAYRVWTGNSDATMDDVLNWSQTSLPVKSVDESIYGPVISEGGDSIFLHYLDEEHQIYRDDGSGPYPALRSYGEGLRGPWMTRLSGVIVYWKMLQAAGVECTFSDAYRDSIGALVATAPDAPKENVVSTEAEAVALQLARCMAAYSWPTIAQANNNDGTELYRQVFAKVLGDDYYKQSCDRGACCAIRWSGADGGFPRGNTKTQIEYLDGTNGGAGPTIWEEISWGGNEALLKPGDILIWSTKSRGLLSNGRSAGHIIVYVGKEIIQQFHAGEASSSAVICHASIGGSSSPSRSPACGGWYDDAKCFAAFRLINPSPNEAYTNAAPYP